jgi:hypothetical protein
MLIDRYTKAVLTVIAGALIGIFAQNAINVSQAQQPSLQKVVICQNGNPALCANVADIGQGIQRSRCTAPKSSSQGDSWARCRAPQRDNHGV